MYFKKAGKVLSRNIVFIALAIAVLGRLAVIYPLNTNLLEGSDFTAHAPKVWYLANEYEKYGDWDPFWYGGYPIFKYYSPLSYYMGGFFALFADATIAYKIIIDIFFLLAPFAFYIFIKGFNLGDAQKAAGILGFSFFITNIYYFWNNAFPTVVNTVFIIFTWIFFKKYAENKNRKNLAFASIFLGLSVLTHQLTAFFNLVLVVSWLVIKYRNFPLKPVILGLLVPSFWLIPFLLGFEKSILKFPEIFSFANNIIYHIGTVGLFSLSAFISILILLSLKYRVEKSFLAVMLIIGAVILFSQQFRIISLIPIPLGIFIAQIYGNAKNFPGMIINFFIVVIVASFALLFFSYHAFSFSGHETWEVPSAGNRVIYIPSPREFCMPEEKCYKFFYSAYLPLRGNQQIMGGWFQESQRIGKLKETKDPYLAKINNPPNVSDDEYYSLLKSGFVNSVVVNRFYPEYVKYFEGSRHFKKVNETEHFIVFNQDTPASYIELNNKSVEYRFERNKNEIKIWLDCEPGELIIKESYDPDWRIYDAADSAVLSFDVSKDGFIKTNITGAGRCEIRLNYNKDIKYLPLSIFALLMVLWLAVSSGKSSYQ